jgi:hypothetical protein
MTSSGFRLFIILIATLFCVNIVLAECYRDCCKECSIKCEIAPPDEITPLEMGVISTLCLTGASIMFYFVARKKWIT